MNSTSEPVIIQGGMGVAISGWRLTRTVSKLGQLGVVSGTALDVILARRLQAGDPGGHMRRALDAFPFPEMADGIRERYFIAGGKDTDDRFKPNYIVPVEPSQKQLELLVVANFVEIYLAKEGHDGLVGVNYLEKIQVPTLPSLYGAMLAGVDYVLMGAGIPRAIPGILDRLSEGKPVELPLYVLDTQRGESFCTRFDPVKFTNDELPWVERPKFLAIVASATLASMLARKASGYVDGFVIEGPTAGGHNAPPRGVLQLNDRGEPVYGERDVVDLEAIQALGRPFWLAGGFGSPQQVTRALEAGAAGVQVGTAFAFCEESGLDPTIRKRVLRQSRDGELDVKTDAVASPTGFPFKVLNLEGTVSEASVYQERERCCDLGFLRQAYRREDGKLGWRCPSEPMDAFLHKGGNEEDTVGRKCVCNALISNVGLEQVQRGGKHELPMITCGDDVKNIRKFLRDPDVDTYSARDVLEYLLGAIEPPVSFDTGDIASAEPFSSGSRSSRTPTPSLSRSEAMPDPARI